MGWHHVIGGDQRGKPSPTAYLGMVPPQPSSRNNELLDNTFDTHDPCSCYEERVFEGVAAINGGDDPRSCLGGQVNTQTYP